MSVREGTCLFNVCGEKIEDLQPFERLKLAIIHRAVLDWDILIYSKAWSGDGSYRHGNAKYSFEEIRSFFKGEWCAMLLERTDSYKPLTLLAILERKLEAARAGER